MLGKKCSLFFAVIRFFHADGMRPLLRDDVEDGANCSPRISRITVVSFNETGRLTPYEREHHVASTDVFKFSEFSTLAIFRGSVFGFCGQVVFQ